MKTRYEFESGWTTSAIEGSPASSEELKNTLKDLSLEKGTERREGADLFPGNAPKTLTGSVFVFRGDMGV